MSSSAQMEPSLLLIESQQVFGTVISTYFFQITFTNIWVLIVLTLQEANWKTDLRNNQLATLIDWTSENCCSDTDIVKLRPMVPHYNQFPFQLQLMNEKPQNMFSFSRKIFILSLVLLCVTRLKQFEFNLIFGLQTTFDSGQSISNFISFTKYLGKSVHWNASGR